MAMRGGGFAGCALEYLSPIIAPISGKVDQYLTGFGLNNPGSQQWRCELSAKGKAGRYTARLHDHDMRLAELRAR